jgi:hypothetical protein
LDAALWELSIVLARGLGAGFTPKADLDADPDNEGVDDDDSDPSLLVLFVIETLRTGGTDLAVAAPTPELLFVEEEAIDDALESAIGVEAFEVVVVLVVVLAAALRTTVRGAPKGDFFISRVDRNQSPQILRVRNNDKKGLAGYHQSPACGGDFYAFSSTNP